MKYKKYQRVTLEDDEAISSTIFSKPFSSIDLRSANVNIQVTMAISSVDTLNSAAAGALVHDTPSRSSNISAYIH